MTAIFVPTESASSRSCVTKDRRRPGRVQNLHQVLAHLRAQRRVQIRERLVQQHDVGFRRERPGKRHALLLASRKFVRVTLRLVRQPDQVKHPGDLMFAVRTRRHAEGNVSRDLEVREQRVVLKDKADPPTVGRDEFMRPHDLAPPNPNGVRRRAAQTPRSGAAASFCRTRSGRAAPASRPTGTSSDSMSTATVSPNRFVSPWHSMAG
jgi:hypothetical protein